MKATRPTREDVVVHSAQNTDRRQNTDGKQNPAARVAPVLLAVAGLLFAAYPATRPYRDETTLDGAAAMSSTAWTLAHTAAMIGFILLPLALLGLRAAVGGTRGEGPAAAAFVTALLGAGLTLPYYGGETFGIKAVSDLATQHADPTMLTQTETVRLDPAPAAFFLGGMLLLAAAGVLTALALNRSGRFPAWAALPFAAGLVLFIPQFFGPAAARVGHGLLLAVGCWVLAWALSRVKAAPRAIQHRE
ncbi:hypothetical protein [Actinokineospora iranica]|uniref:DUF4386 family protein n=1 Tax=Actinokineospora iranica TaxID=1271860 RepID=A0A1G6JW04_9PSEU|nr:hypothetical protein [Actinokineospora iranica]SDC22932.1 hypothetical protein SAMN05216174_101589 [Actinokineospora iranica]